MTHLVCLDAADIALVFDNKALIDAITRSEKQWKSEDVTYTLNRALEMKMRKMADEARENIRRAEKKAGQ